MTMRSLLPFALLLATGCGQKAGGDAPASPVSTIPVAKVEAGKEASIMPLAKGNEWTYTWEQTATANGRTTSNQRDLTWRVVQATKIPGGVRATIELSMKGLASDRQTWRMDASGLYQEKVSRSKPAYQPALPVLRFPVADHEKFRWSGRGMSPVESVGPMTLDGHVTGAQEVDTDMGRMSAIAIESTSRFSFQRQNGIALNTAWFRPGVGMVRLRSEVAIGNVIGITIFKLKSTNLKTS
ncbi:MAG: hypothetical protein ACO1SV_19845 [Fimbriimonas sp.]